MKEQTNNQTKRIAPTFATEEEEAAWWYENRNVHGKQLLAAVKSGKARLLTNEELLARLTAPKKKAAPTVKSAKRCS